MLKCGAKENKDGRNASAKSMWEILLLNALGTGVDHCWGKSNRRGSADVSNTDAFKWEDL